jgi:hypothetical protein
LAFAELHGDVDWLAALACSPTAAPRIGQGERLRMRHKARPMAVALLQVQ